MPESKHCLLILLNKPRQGKLPAGFNPSLELWGLSPAESGAGAQPSRDTAQPARICIICCWKAQMGFNNPAISVIKCVGFNSVTASPALTAPVIRNLTESWERLSAQCCCSQSSCFSLNFFGDNVRIWHKGGIPAWDHQGRSPTRTG